MYRAQRINSIIGGAGITPWELNAVPEDDIKDIEAYMSYQKQFSGIAARKKAEEAKKNGKQV